MNNGNGNDQHDFQIFKTIIKYSIVIIILPIVSFFVAKRFLFDFMLDTINSNVYSAVVSVVVLHIAIGMYIYRAYAEADKAPPAKPVKID